MATENTGVKCALPTCEGSIIKETQRKYLGDSVNRFIGPGGDRQLTEVSELYCPSCGITYHHLPTQK